MAGIRIPTRRALTFRPSLRTEETFNAYLFLTPTLLMLLVFIALPLGYSLALTLTGPGDAPGKLGSWVGFEHWRKVWPSLSSGFPFLDPPDRLFNKAFLQSLQYVGMATVGATIVGFVVALVLNQDFPGRAIVRASLLVPWAIPPVVVAAMFQWFLDSRRGLLNYWLERTGVSEQLQKLGFAVADGRIPFFDDRWVPSWLPISGTMLTFTAIHIWKTFPLMAIIFLVALQYLPKDVLDAARLDGASTLSRLRRIVLPLLAPTMVAAVVVEFLLTVTMFDIIFTLGSGGVKESVINLYVYAYRQSFFLGDLHYGAVLAYVVSALVVGFALCLTRGRLRAPL